MSLASSSLPDLFPGFSSRRVTVGGQDVFMRIGGSGPPLLLLHGFPQTHVCWHNIAAELAQAFTLIIPDLPGYGQSACARGVDQMPGSGYAKRGTAEVMIKVMANLGYQRFLLCGHDRGGRVSYRLALDHADVITRLAILDILPTEEVWRRITPENAQAAYHWTFLAQPSPYPERLIAGDHEYFVRHTLASWTQAKSLGAFSPGALLHYVQAMSMPERIAAACEDYRAGAGIDRTHDQETLAAGKKIACPTLVLWGSNYMGRGSASPLDIWRTWAANVTGSEIASGHFLAEENPKVTLASLLPFLRGE